MSSVSPTNQDLSNYTTFSQIKSRVPVPLKGIFRQQSAAAVFFLAFLKLLKKQGLF